MKSRRYRSAGRWGAACGAVALVVGGIVLFGGGSKEESVGGEATPLEAVLPPPAANPDHNDPLGNLPRIPWEGGANYYAQFPRSAASGWADPGFFPIALWYPNGGNDASVQFDKSFGINTYVENNPDVPYSVYAANGMHFVGGPNDTFPAPDDAVAWSGRFLGDEIDGRFDVSAGHAYLQSAIDEIPSDDGRFQYANFTAIVAANYNPTQIRADETYVNMYRGPVSVDAYWYTDPHCSVKPYVDWSFVGVTQENCRTASSYGKTVQSVRARDASDGDLKPIWAFVELLGAGNDDPAYNFTITPGQLQGAAMNSIINEARGIIWFNQRFSGGCEAGTLLRTVQVDANGCAAANAAGMRQVNLIITSLAPVLNTQSYEYSFGPGLNTMLKWHEGAAYVFAMIDGSSQPGSRTLTLPPGLASPSSVTDLTTNRVITPANGVISDTFTAEYTYHIYKINP